MLLSSFGDNININNNNINNININNTNNNELLIVHRSSTSYEDLKIQHFIIGDYPKDLMVLRCDELCDQYSDYIKSIPTNMLLDLIFDGDNDFGCADIEINELLSRDYNSNIVRSREDFLEYFVSFELKYPQSTKQMRFVYFSYLIKYLRLCLKNGNSEKENIILYELYTNGDYSIKIAVINVFNDYPSVKLMKWLISLWNKHNGDINGLVYSILSTCNSTDNITSIIDILMEHCDVSKISNMTTTLLKIKLPELIDDGMMHHKRFMTKIQHIFYELIRHGFSCNMLKENTLNDKQLMYIVDVILTDV